MQPAARRLFYTDGFKKGGMVPGKVTRLVDKFCESLWKVRLSITCALSFDINTVCIAPYLIACWKVDV